MKFNNPSTTRRVATLGLGVALSLSFMSGTAAATSGSSPDSDSRGNQGQTSSTKDCDGTHHSDTGHGANRSGAYDNTCDGSPSGNGNGGGNAGGKPCAGCVGNADDKNPPGQAPDGSDHNNGYECDGNSGVGRTNPAHTGCSPSSEPAPGDDNGSDDNGSDDNGGGNPSETPECPAGKAAMTAHHYVLNGSKRLSDLTGKVHAGDTVKAFFTVAAGCPDAEFSLVSYTAPSASYDRKTADQQRLHDSDTGHFATGDHVLDVSVPSCYFQVDFVRGAPITRFGPADSNNFYGDQGRLMDADNGGLSSCAVDGVSENPQNPGGNTPSNTPGNTPSNGGPAVAGETATAGPNNDTPASAAESAPGGGAAAVSGTTVGRPTEVLGVQLDRGSVAAGLARTGLSMLPLAGVGMGLMLAGVALTLVRRRDTGDETFVAIAGRLVGF